MDDQYLFYFLAKAKTIVVAIKNSFFSLDRVRRSFAKNHDLTAIANVL